MTVPARLPLTGDTSTGYNLREGSAMLTLRIRTHALQKLRVVRKNVHEPVKAA